MPRNINPTIVVTLILVNQNSISPYLLTLKRLNKIGMTRNIVIHAAGGTSVVQKVMKFAVATALLG
jgi:hypothetical protein